LLLDLLRKVTISNKELKSSLWKKTDFLGTELRGKVLGIIGYGKIGHVVAEIATGFGMTVKTANSKSTAGEIDDLLSTSDIVSLHVPQNEDTAHLIHKDRLNMMKKDAVLVNTARGPVVDQEALYNHLREGRIAGAALDVFEDEPLDGNVGNKILELVMLPNVIATPHIAFNTKEAIYKIGEEVIDNIDAAVKGEPINVVN
jgi:D-3-phosphoglycerate dehydrogenase